jgi:hypothetical protein
VLGIGPPPRLAQKFKDRTLPRIIHALEGPKGERSRAKAMGLHLRRRSIRSKSSNRSNPLLPPPPGAGGGQSEGFNGLNDLNVLNAMRQ